MAKRPNRIIVKLGTGILTNAARNALDRPQFVRITAEVAALVKAGHRVAIVSSGAVGAGMMRLGVDRRPDDLPGIQACAAVGQSRLMNLYESLFAKHRLGVAQLLLTHPDIDSRSRYENARNTLARLFEHRDIVPIINENDSVATEELRFGDNDRLSAEVACLADADLLILLTSADGLMRSIEEQGAPIPVVRDVDAVAHFATATKGRLSVGGMVSKLQAVKYAVTAGVPVVIANGRTPGVLARAVAGEKVGTRFLARRKG